MVVRKHGPESPQGNSRKMYAQLRKITFQVGTDKSFAPLPAGGKAPGKQRAGKTMKIRIYKPIFHVKYDGIVKSGTALIAIRFPSHTPKILHPGDMFFP